MTICDILENNILQRYEELYGKSIYLDIQKKKIKPYISIDCSNSTKIRSPFANSRGEINIQSDYIDFLWAFCYGTWVQYEENLMKSLLIQQGNNVIQNQTIIKQACQLLECAQKKKINPWPNTNILPNDGSFYSQRVNGIFLDVLMIILFHETAHIVCDHFSENDNNFEKKEKEKEADIFAIEHVMKESCINQNTSDFISKSIAITIAFSSFLFLIDSPSLIKQDKHPNLDSRIFIALEKLDIKDEKFSFYAYNLADTLIRHFYNLNKDFYENRSIFFENKLVNTAKDLFLTDLETISL